MSEFDAKAATWDADPVKVARAAAVATAIRTFERALLGALAEKAGFSGVDCAATAANAYQRGFR